MEQKRSHWVLCNDLSSKKIGSFLLGVAATCNFEFKEKLFSTLISKNFWFFNDCVLSRLIIAYIRVILSLFQIGSDHIFWSWKVKKNPEIMRENSHFFTAYRLNYWVSYCKYCKSFTVFFNHANVALSLENLKSLLLLRLSGILSLFYFCIYK